MRLPAGDNNEEGTDRNHVSSRGGNNNTALGLVDKTVLEDQISLERNQRTLFLLLCTFHSFCGKSRSESNHQCIVIFCPKGINIHFEFNFD